MERNICTRIDISARTLSSSSSDQPSQRNPSSKVPGIDKSPVAARRLAQGEKIPKSPQVQTAKPASERLPSSAVPQSKVGSDSLDCSIPQRLRRRSRQDVTVAPYYVFAKSPRPGGPHSSMRFRDQKPVVEISLGIENEFLAEGCAKGLEIEPSSDFICNMAVMHNQSVPKSHPKMESQVRYGEDITSRPPRDFTCWVVELEEELKGQDDASRKRKLTLLQPLLC